MQPSGHPVPHRNGRALWIAVTVATTLLSGVLTLAGLSFGLVSLAFFDDPTAPGAYPALFGMMLFAASCVATLAVPLVFWLWGRRAGAPGLITRRLLLCSAGYLAPLALGIVQFGFLMH
jgi:hypothetical protein